MINMKIKAKYVKEVIVVIQSAVTLINKSAFIQIVEKSIPKIVI